VFFLVICVIYTASAFRIQSLYGSKEEVKTDDYKTRKVAVYAMRGEIYDRNGNKLVGNVYNYSLMYDYSAMAKTYADSTVCTSSAR
jgi:cell division protein FtsI/penicillin-binding protein 2